MSGYQRLLEELLKGELIKVINQLPEFWLPDDGEEYEGKITQEKRILEKVVKSRKGRER